MRVVFMGTPWFAVPFLKHLVLEGYEIAAVYTQPDKPAGRGRQVIPSPVKKAALELGLPVVQPVKLNQPDTVAELARFKPAVIVITAYGQILPQAVLDMPPFECVNVHFSLLPRHRGAVPVMAAILAGDAFTGVSIMLVTKKLDTGPVLARLSIPISDQDTTESLLYKLARVGARFLPDVLGRWLNNEIVPQPQNEAGASYFAQVGKEAGEIDWRQPAVAIWRRVRAFYPWPGGYTRWQGRQLKIIEAVPLPGDGVLRVGQVIPLAAAVPPFGIGSGDGIIGVLKVQMEGRQVMTADEFLRGHRDFIGAVLPS